MKIVKVVLLSAFCLLLVNVANAQGPPPPPPPPLTPPGTDVPMDKEVVLLLLAASVFGVYKLRSRKIVG